MKTSERGQGLVETLLGLPIMVLIATALVALLYRSIIYHVGDYQAHEALICTQSESLSFCKRELESRLNGVLVTKAKYRVQLQQNWRGSSSITLEIDLKPPLKIEKTLPRI